MPKGDSFSRLLTRKNIGFAKKQLYYLEIATISHIHFSWGITMLFAHFWL